MYVVRNTTFLLFIFTYVYSTLLYLLSHIGFKVQVESTSSNAVVTLLFRFLWLYINFNSISTSLLLSVWRIYLLVCTSSLCICFSRYRLQTHKAQSQYLEVLQFFITFAPVLWLRSNCRQFVICRIMWMWDEMESSIHVPLTLFPPFSLL